MNPPSSPVLVNLRLKGLDCCVGLSHSSSKTTDFNLQGKDVTIFPAILQIDFQLFHFLR